MKLLKLMNYAQGHWTVGSDLASIPSAVTGDVVAETGSRGLDFAAMAAHARAKGGPALRAMTFHERAQMLKALADRGDGEEGRALRTLLRNRRHEVRRLDRYRRRRGHAVRLFLQGPPRTSERHDPHRRQRRRTVEEGHLRRPACVDVAAGRGAAHQRVQLSRLGHAGEARPHAACRRARHRQARDRDGLSRRGRVPHHDRGGRAARQARCNSSSEASAICSII